MNAENSLRKRKRQKQRRHNRRFRDRLTKGLSLAPCYYCHRAFLVDDLTLEHIIPLCLGGTNNPDNLALACCPCNQARGKEAWSQKRELNKGQYEQHSSQYREQSR